MSETTYEYLRDTFNGAFLLTILGICTGLCSGCLAFILKSRCSKIKCGCIEVQREVLSSDEMKNATIDMKNNHI